MADKLPHRTDSDIRRAVHDLFAAYLCDDWSDAQAAEFTALLTGSPVARETYVWLAHQQTALRMTLGPAISLQGNNRQVSDSLEGEMLAGDMPLLQLGCDLGDLPPHSLHGGWGSSWSSYVPLLSVVLAVLVGVGVWWGARQQQPQPQVAQEEPSDLPAAIAETPVMEIGTMNIESGTVRIKLPRVGYMVVEGPSKLTLVSPMRLELDKGKIKLSVTEPSGHGFVVATPHGEITDLGTEFGVDASHDGASELVVFDGAVDLRVPGLEDSPSRFTRGEGVRFDGRGQFDRIMSIATGNVATFELPARSEHSPSSVLNPTPVLLDVEDNRRARQTHRFYEIVQRGLAEGADAYVDRHYNWSGAGDKPLPPYLLGADYIKTFNDDKVFDVKIDVTLSTPADLYLFWDERVPPTEWLEEGFTRLEELLELEERGVQDLGTDERRDLIRTFSIWHRHVDSQGTVELGSIQMVEARTSMYGIAASRRSPEVTPSDDAP